MRWLRSAVEVQIPMGRLLLCGCVPWLICKPIKCQFEALYLVLPSPVTHTLPTMSFAPCGKSFFLRHRQSFAHCLSRLLWQTLTTSSFDCSPTFPRSLHCVVCITFHPKLQTPFRPAPFNG